MAAKFSQELATIASQSTDISSTTFARVRVIGVT